VVDAMRPEFAKFFPDDVRDADGAVVVMRGPVPVPAAGAVQSPMDALIADTAWQTTVELPASDGQRYAYTLGILLPSTGEGCEY